MALGILWDIDGTLLDSNDAHARAYAEALREDGLDFPIELIRRLIGMGGDHLLPELADIDSESPRGRRITAWKKGIFHERHLPFLNAFPRAAELVRELERRGFRMGAASSASGEELEDLLECAGVAELLSVRTDADDVESSKPEPDIVHAALARLGLEPVDAILIGDSPYDATAARRAGVPFIGLRSGGWSGAELRGAIAVYEDPADVLAHLDESPLAWPHRVSRGSAA